MLIAAQKKKENIAEYLLYMWQIEDLIRAYKLDIDIINNQLIEKFDQPDSVKKEMRDWYEQLIEMMRAENVIESGHLQINNNVLIQLTDLHLRILNSSDQNTYKTLYYQTLPFIVELREKAGENKAGEIETCFSALYGVLLLKLQQKEITENTQTAVKQIGKFLAVLSAKYNAEQKGELELD